MATAMVRFRWLSLQVGIAGLLVTSLSAQEDWTFLDNGSIRLGVNRSEGAAVGWFSESRGSENFLNYYDQGRYLQQSWYGDSDGSDWNGKPWVWNPVQGGGYRGERTDASRFEAVGPDRLHAVCQPHHWATGEPIPEVQFEQWIELKGQVAEIRFRMTYSGEKSYAPRHQELPAVFVNDRLSELVVYEGEKPWTGDNLSRSVPGWPNERRQMTENWAAYIDPETGRGIGVYVPVADTLTCYRFGKPGGKGACSYLAPVKTIAITPEFSFEYRVWLTLGSVEEIRQRFSRIRKENENQSSTKP